MNCHSRFINFIVFLFLLFISQFSFAEDKPKSQASIAAELRSKSCIKKFQPENKDLKLTDEQIKWIHESAKSVDSPLANMTLRFFSSQIDRSEFGKSLGYTLEKLSASTVQPPANKYQKSKMSDFDNVHGGLLASTDLMGKEIIGQLIRTPNEYFIITRKYQEMITTTFQIYRFVSGQLVGQAYFSWPAKEVRQTVGKKYVDGVTEVYFSDKLTANALMSVLFPTSQYLAYKPQVTRALEMTELAAEEFLRKKQTYATAQKLVEKVQKRNGQVINASIGSHSHKIFIARMDKKLRTELAPYSVNQFFVDDAELLVAIDTHGEGRLTLIDINAMKSGYLNAYRQSVDGRGYFSHIQLSSDGTLYETPDQSIDNLTDSIDILNRDLR